MKVFKFYCGQLFYIVSAITKDIAIQYFYEETGDEFTICEEIPESDWNEKVIVIWEDNDQSKQPFKVSIREIICGIEPQMISTNGSHLF